MLYIVTYATHSERYFDVLKESCPDITVLGMGTKWNGFGDKAKGVSDFCKSKNPDDLVCFVDGFDSVIIEKVEIEKRYKKLGHELVVSSPKSIRSVLEKYVSDKLFSSCAEDGARLNSGMYIGTARSIIKLWSGFEDGGDDQLHVTKKCKDVYIDIDNLLFYNYSASDSVEVREGKLYKEGDISIPIVSCPAHGNINNILVKIGYSNLPDIKVDYVYRLKTYGKLFLPEILWILASILLLFKLHNKKLAVFISFVSLLEVINFEVHVKHLDIHGVRKILFSLLDFLHISIIALVFWLMYKSNNLKNLLILNTIFLIMLLLFFHFKKCIVTIIENKVAGIDDDYMSVSRGTRLGYLIDVNQKYKKEKGKSVFNWMDGNKLIVIIIIILNIVTLWKLRRLKALSLK
jgi:hypothetical protein